MKQITLTILAEDILLDNYMNSKNCPITRALHRAGELKLGDSGYINGWDKEGNWVVINNDNFSYRKLVIKLFSMYLSFNNSFKTSGDVILTPIPVEDFVHTITY
jgi:hypothetical protein